MPLAVYKMLKGERAWLFSFDFSQLAFQRCADRHLKTTTGRFHLGIFNQGTAFCHHPLWPELGGFCARISTPALISTTRKPFPASLLTFMFRGEGIPYGIWLVCNSALREKKPRGGRCSLIPQVISSLSLKSSSVSYLVNFGLTF